MTRKKARHLNMELCRRLYEREHGTLKGFGIIAKWYSDSWRHTDYSKTGGYKATWNNDVMVQLRKSVGM